MSNENLAQIHSVERTQVVSAVFILAVSLYFFPVPAVVAGIACGAVLAFLNFRFLCHMAHRIISDGDTGASKKFGRIMVKLGLLFGVFGILTYFVGLDPIALFAGYSSIVFAIVVQGLKSLF